LHKLIAVVLDRHTLELEVVVELGAGYNAAEEVLAKGGQSAYLVLIIIVFRKINRPT